MKKKFLKRITAAVLSAALVCSVWTPVMAEENLIAAESVQDEEEEVKTVIPEGAENAEEIVFEETDLPVGDLMVPEFDEEEVGQIATQRELDELDRTMRAYEAPADTLLKNKAKHFYYYEKLNEDEQMIYEAMQMACEDPENASSVGLYFSEEKPYTEKFWKTYRKCLSALLCDHAEYFWLYNRNDTEFYLRSSSTAVNGYYSVYVYMENGVKDYQKKQKAFNKAAKEFLADIDTTKENKSIAKAIHDKLTKTVAYDHKVCDNSIYSDYAHTAYGALVANSRGDEHKAVCDGYSLAFVYLCQQVGINAVVIYGYAGSNKKSMGGHAWSMVKIEKAWKEVDVTWDDVGTRKENIKSSYAKGSVNYNIFMEALKDKDYSKKLGHYLYRVSTAKISHYTPPSDDKYYSKDGKYWVSMLSESVHVRDSGDDYYAGLMKLAPTAK